MDDLEEIGGWVLEEEARRATRRTGAAPRADAEFDAALRRRRDFELRLGAHPEDVTEDQRERAWELAATDPLPDRMTRAEVREYTGSARSL